VGKPRVYNSYWIGESAKYLIGRGMKDEISIRLYLMGGWVNQKSLVANGLDAWFASSLWQLVYARFSLPTAPGDWWLEGLVSQEHLVASG